MRAARRFPMALGIALIACEGTDTQLVRDSLQSPADSHAAARAGEPKPADSAAREALGKEPGHIPATPTPTITAESSIAAMRSQLQRLDSANAQQLQAGVSEHARRVGDLLTTMRLEVSAATSAGKDAWLAAADTVEGDLDKLAIARGSELQAAFRRHRTRVLTLLDGFRALVPRASQGSLSGS